MHHHRHSTMTQQSLARASHVRRCLPLAACFGGTTEKALQPSMASCSDDVTGAVFLFFTRNDRGIIGWTRAASRLCGRHQSGPTKHGNVGGNRSDCGFLARATRPNHFDWNRYTRAPRIYAGEYYDNRLYAITTGLPARYCRYKQSTFRLVHGSPDGPDWRSAISTAIGRKSGQLARACIITAGRSHSWWCCDSDSAMWLPGRR